MGAPIHLTVSPGDDLPLYRQIVRQVRQAVAAGRLGPGDRLPSHRELGARLVISPLTVKKAYDELERGGVLETARGQGTFVRRDVARRAGDERREALRGAVRRLVHEAHLAGVRPRELAGLLREERARLEAERSERTREEAFEKVARR